MANFCRKPSQSAVADSSPEVGAMMRSDKKSIA